jgi:phosphoribosylanthranilate isomerase
VRVKICGITRLEDAELAAELGAWAIGFILWPDSKRFVEPGVAAGIARVMRRKVELVGVFVNQPLDDVVALVDSIGLTYVQLHGDEGPSFCQAVHQRTGAKVIKAGRITHASDLREMDRYRVDLHLLDAGTADGTYGGTGKTWDWSLVASRRSRIPFLLAGGLNADNVADAIAATQPWGIDLSSGVEASPGVKDPEKLRALFAVVDEVAPATAPPEPRKPETLVYPPREDEAVDAARLAKPDGGARRPREVRR